MGKNQSRDVRIDKKLKDEKKKKKSKNPTQSTPVTFLPIFLNILKTKFIPLFTLFREEV
jgi:hypothetical protein